MLQATRGDPLVEPPPDGLRQTFVTVGQPTGDSGGGLIELAGDETL